MEEFERAGVYHKVAPGSSLNITVFYQSDPEHETVHFASYSWKSLSAPLHSIMIPESFFKNVSSVFDFSEI